MNIRFAQAKDIDALNAIEKLFQGDRISARQMKRFITSPHARFFVAEHQEQISGYALMLFHQGTQLARLYSIAVAPQFRGQGIAQNLMKQCELSALEQGAVTLRLEVREDNISAINLYKKLGFNTLKLLVHYYDDHSDGVRMQKRLTPETPKVTLSIPLYIQTTPFSCGAACLLMSFATLDKHFQPSRTQELQLWREATTIFMAAGHGGCSGHGLALAALKRGYNVDLYTKTNGIPFIDSVRDENKKAVIELVHADFCQQLAHHGVKEQTSAVNSAQLAQWLKEGKCVLLLISTYRFDGKKEPHWVILSGMSEQFFFLHDPYASNEKEATSCAFVPVGKRMLEQILTFGRQKHSACVVVSRCD